MKSPLHFGHYEVVCRDDGHPLELGRGAMGITYKAVDTALQREVALKVINPENLVGDAARQRFLREARAAAQLKHPNVASVFHLGVEGDTHFYAMEFIDGETLDSLIERQGSLSCSLALRITSQVAAALGAAHASNLIHRDIKPANLMVVADTDGQPFVKVIDFGLAKNAGVPGPRDATVSVGGFFGTPHYASPEQLEEKDLDIRSDIYSLGATFWQMLTGRTLYTGSLARVMIGHVSEAPPIDRIDAPPEVATLLRTMLAKDPTERYQTPADLLASIREVESCVDPNYICDTSGLGGAGGNGFKLQELLRVRRSLPLEETLMLLRRMAEALDCVAERGAATVDLRVHSIWIDFARPSSGTASALMRKPMSEWLDFSLRFCHFLDTANVQSDTSDDGKTLLDMPACHESKTYIHGMASVGYELLSGQPSGLAPSGYLPLAALTEKGNHVMARALCEAGTSYRTGDEFCAALEAAAPESAVRYQRRIPQLVAAPPDAPAGVGVPQLPASRSLAPVAWATVFGVTVGCAVIWFNMDPRQPSPTSRSIATPAAAGYEPRASATTVPKAPSPHPTANAQAPSTPASTPGMIPGQRLKLALGEFAQAKAAGDIRRAFAGAIKLNKDFPKYEKDLVFLDELLGDSKSLEAIRRDWPAYAGLVQEAADLGNGKAMILCAENVAATKPEEAFRLYRNAADRGVPRAMTQVGMMCLRGQGVMKDVDQAEKWFQMASKYNDSSGTFALGESYLTGRGVKLDAAKAVKLLQDAAEQHSGDAKNLLGKLYLHGEAGFPVSRANAMELFRQAKELSCPEAYYNLGMLDLSPPTRGKALPGRAAFLFQQGAALGSGVCTYSYARCLEEGIGLTAVPGEAKEWYQKALEPLRKESDAGSVAATLYYANCLEHGKGVKTNLMEAARYYSKAAGAGDPTAIQWCADRHLAYKAQNANQTPLTVAIPRDETQKAGGAEKIQHR